MHETLGDKHDAIAQNQFSLAKELLNHEIEVRTHLRIMRFAMTTKKEFSKYSAPGGPRIDGVVDVRKVSLYNKNDGAYSSVFLDFDKVLSRDGTYIETPKNAIKELKFPDLDIKGTAK